LTSETGTSPQHPPPQEQWTANDNAPTSPRKPAPPPGMGRFVDKTV
jgi:hypothetical protein